MTGRRLEVTGEHHEPAGSPTGSLAEGGGHGAGCLIRTPCAGGPGGSLPPTSGRVLLTDEPITAAGGPAGPGAEAMDAGLRCPQGQAGHSERRPGGESADHRAPGDTIQMAAVDTREVW